MLKRVYLLAMSILLVMVAFISMASKKSINTGAIEYDLQALQDRVRQKRG